MLAKNVFNNMFILLITESLGYCFSEGRRGGRRAIVLAVAGLTAICAGVYFSGITRCREWWDVIGRGWGGELAETPSIDNRAPSAADHSVHIVIPDSSLSSSSAPLQFETAVVQSQTTSFSEQLSQRAEEIDRLLNSAPTSVSSLNG